MRATTICLKHDPNFVAAKKKDANARRAEELVGSQKTQVYMTTALEPRHPPDNCMYNGLVCPYGRIGLRGSKRATRGEAGVPRQLMMTMMVATQFIKGDAMQKQVLEENDTETFTIMVMMIIFLLGFIAGCCCSRCCQKTARAAGPTETPPTRTRPRPTRASSSAAAATLEEEPDQEPTLREPLLQTAEPTTIPPPPPMANTRYPQTIWVTRHGSQYHVMRSCTGLNAATTASQKYACNTCISEVDGDGLRRRAQ